MKYQEYILDETEKAAQQAFRYARAVPDDKLDWAPEGARSVLAICRELAMCPTWADEIVRGVPMEFDEAAMEQGKKEQSQWKGVAECEAEFQRRMEPFAQTVRSIPDERLQETRFLPFEGGRDFTMVEMMAYPQWNSTYHAGQIAYIQTMYGDRQMY